MQNQLEMKHNNNNKEFDVTLTRLPNGIKGYILKIRGWPFRTEEKELDHPQGCMSL